MVPQCRIAPYSAKGLAAAVSGQASCTTAERSSVTGAPGSDGELAVATLDVVELDNAVDVDEHRRRST
jgi:hypothetical protein